MFYEFGYSPFYISDQSFYIPNNYDFNVYDNANEQRVINNNTTSIDISVPSIYFDDFGKKNEENENNSIKKDFNKNQGGDNFNDEGFKTPTEKNQSKYKCEKKSDNLGNINTKATSFTGKKTKRTKDKNFENCENDEKIKCGRKAKDSLIKGNHNKHSEDNIMRKIKSNFFKYINEQLNRKVKNKNKMFLKLDSKISENLKRDYNISLMNQKIKNIYLNAKISSKYRTQRSTNYDLNIKIIEETYSGMEEMDVINTLELSYLDLFEKFRNNYLDQVLNHIRDEEEKKNESEKDINEYLEKIKKLCLNYEEWFKNKKGRNRTKNNE